MPLGRLKNQKNASRGHSSAGQYLKKILPYANILQEVSYKDLMKLAYKKSRTAPELQNIFLMNSSSHMRADWVIPDLDLVIEINGEQHFEAVRFGGISQDEAEHRLLAQSFLDKKKKLCVKEIGWKLFEYRVLHNQEFLYADFKKSLNGFLHSKNRMIEKNDEKK